MIVIKHAEDLKTGDVFSTDGYITQSATQLHDGRVSVETAKGFHVKRALLAADFPCPIWTPDGDPTGMTETALEVLADMDFADTEVKRRGY